MRKQLVGLICGVFFFGRTVAACPEPLLLPQPPIPVTNYPTALALGDLDGDGDLDLVIGDSTQNITNDAIVTRPGDGKGAFGVPTSYVAGDGIDSIVLADLDGDGDLDIASANDGSASVSVLLGHGDGGFDPSKAYYAGANPYSIVTGDFDEDGHLDIAVANFFNASVSILLGDGAGGFGPPQSFPVGNYPISLAVGDVNGDGHLDVAVARAYVDYDVALFAGDGHGTFSYLAKTITLGYDLRSIALVDLDDDSTLDLVAVDAFWPAPPAVKILQGAGNGEFFWGSSVPVGGQPIGLGVADLTADGFLDIVTANYDGNSLSVLVGDGHLGFDHRFDFPTTGPVGLALADADGNGSPDVFTTNYYQQHVSSFLNGCEANRPPNCSEAAPSVSSLWPPNHAMTPVEIDGVTDPDGDPVEVRATAVTQDEPLGGETHCEDAAISSGGEVTLRAERVGSGNGRVYAVSFEATDGKGGSCEGRVSVCVPHDEPGGACEDDGQAVSSLGPCRPALGPAPASPRIATKPRAPRFAPRR